MSDPQTTTDQEPGPRPTPVRTEDSRPTVIVDGLHVIYHVFATGRPVKGEAGKRLLKRAPALRRMHQVHALKGVSFTAYEGDAIGVIGHNGSGKSTMLRALCGLTPAARGTIYADGKPTLLGVNAAMINEMSGERNIVLGGLALGMTREEVAERYTDIASFAGIDDFLDLPMRTYSSGMQARLRFAIAASVSHRVLMIDEALAVGDKQFQLRSEARIAQLREQAGTVFLVSHSMQSILDTCNRTIWIHKGELRMDGPTAEVVAAYEESVKK
ncbi:MAG: ABC transporter ATP-binding protein [Kineosporiaceae bacterium]